MHEDNPFAAELAKELENKKLLEDIEAAKDAIGDLPTEAEPEPEEEKVTKTAKSKKAKQRKAEREIEEVTKGVKSASIEEMEHKLKLASMSPDAPENAVNATNAEDQIGSNPDLYDGTANVTPDMIMEMERREEIEAALIRENGRYIESVDNAKPGVPFTGKQANDPYMTPVQIIKPDPHNYIAEGGEVHIDGDIFDPGAGAQPAPVLKIDPDTEEPYDINDPRSEQFMVCGNGNCAYREHCLRYRMKDDRPNNIGIFFPDHCRLDGLFIDVNETDYTGYGTFENERLNKKPNINKDT